VPNEDYFEWITLVEAAVEARDHFTMIELGAGWGRWLLNGAFAVRQTSDVPVTLVGVESEPRHFAWMRQHLADNGIEPEEQKLVSAAVAGEDGCVWFRVGDAAHWYGQSIADGELPSRTRAGAARLGRFLRARFGWRDKRGLQLVPAISLTTLLRPFTRVD
jgi:hypothetical protein